MKVKQSSYQSGIPIYDYKLELKEALEITSLALGVLEFNPYFYRESFPNDRFTIEAKVLISEEHHNILKSLCQSKDDVQVIRHGISETPLRMTIGQPYWSKQEQNFKHHLYLLGEKKEKTWESLAMAFTWMSPMRKLVSEQQVLIGELLTILEEKTVLTKEETEKLRRDSQENAWDIRFDFYQVDDIDD